MNFSLRGCGAIGLIAIALVAPPAVAADSTVFGRVVFDARQNALVLPYFGPAPGGLKKTLSPTRVTYVFPAVHFLSPTPENQNLKGPLAGFSVVNLQAGGVVVTLRGARSLMPRLEVNRETHHVLLFLFTPPAPKAEPMPSSLHVPLPLVSDAPVDTTLVGSAVFVAKDDTLVVPFTGPRPRPLRKSLGPTHFYYDLPAARLSFGHVQKQNFNGPLTRLEVANRRDGAVRIAFESTTPMAPQARVDAGHVVIALEFTHPPTAPASALPPGSVRTQVQGAFFDSGRQALILRYTGALPSYALNRVGPAAFGLDFSRSALMPSASNNASGSNPAARWWLTAAPQDQGVHVNVNLPKPGDLLVAADGRHGQLLLIPQPAGPSPVVLPPQSGVKTIFGRARFDWYTGGVALSYSGLTPPYLVEPISPETMYVDFANADMKPDGVQLERVSRFAHLSSWLLAKRPSHDVVRLALSGLAGAHVKIQDDRAHHRLLVTPALALPVKPAPSATTAQDATGAMRAASPGMR